MRFPLTLLASLIALAALSAAPASVRVLVGPTPIPRASARANGDITVVNEKLAFALAVASAAPYGVPRGAIVAVAPVRHGRIDRNRVVFADFIPNNVDFVLQPPQHDSWYALSVEDQQGHRAYTNPVWVQSPQ